MYIKAGTQKTLEQWEQKLGKINKYDISEWFYDLSKPQPEPERDEIRDVINEVFDQHGLLSITYKQAAREVVTRILRSKEICSKQL